MATAEALDGETQRVIVAKWYHFCTLFIQENVHCCYSEDNDCPLALHPPPPQESISDFNLLYACRENLVKAKLLLLHISACIL